MWKHKERVRIVRNSIVLLFEMKKQPRIGKQNEHWNELNWLKIQWMNARNRNCVGKTLKVSKNRIALQKVQWMLALVKWNLYSRMGQFFSDISIFV